MMRSTVLACVLCLLPACGSEGSDGSDGSDDAPGSNVDPPGEPVSDALSDEFDDASTRSRWRLWQDVSGEDPRHELLDIDQTHPGMLTIRPRAGGWYAEHEGPLLYKLVDGDFLVETWVAASKVGDPDAPPDQPYNSAGLLVRDPNHAPGRDNWVMYNVGRQDGRVASEGKTTVDSQSVLELVEGARQGRLRICRLGSQLVLARQLDGEAAFTVTQRYDRGDLPGTLQVGTIVNGWNSLGPEPNLDVAPDLEATFDYVRFSRPTTEADCTAP